MKRHSRKKVRKNKTKKQKTLVMIGCSKNKRVFSCKKCGPNCHCGPNCNCKHKCPGSCYLNHSITKKGIKRGGSGCGSCGCPIAPYAIKGGKSFSNNPVLINGNNDKFGEIIGIGQNGGMSKIPGPIVGSPWSSINLPGMDGVGGNRNYFSQYDTIKDPSYQMSMNNSGYTNKNSMIGGYTYKRKHKKQSTSDSIKGGGIIPQDLVNLGRDFSFNLKSAYNTFNGYPSPVNPLPYKDQLNNSINSKILM